MKKLSNPPVSSITDQVFDHLFQAITQLELSPGSKLSEADISEQLGVSRQPVRDAFFRLSQRGYVQILPQRGTFVSRISEEQVLNAMFVRTALECACIEEVPALSANQIKTLSDILEQQHHALEAKDGPRFNALDESFHSYLCEISGRGHIWVLILEQKGHLDRLRWLSLAYLQQEALKEHQGILDALTLGRTDRAKSLLKAHLTKAQHLLPQIREGNPALFSEG